MELEGKSIYAFNYINSEETMIYQRAAVSSQLSVFSNQLSAIIRKLFTIHCSLFTNKKGFTLIELMITMVVFVLVIAAASQVFTGLLTQFKQQSKITETNIEGVVGLEIMRRDIESAGYGLPWNVTGVANWTNLTGYCEADSLSTITPDPANFNDGNGVVKASCAGSACPACGAPRAILSGNNADFNNTTGNASNIFDGSDYLVIKAVNVAINTAAQRWTRLRTDIPKKRTWGTAADDFANTDRVIVISPGTSDDATRQSLVVSGSWWTTYNNTDPFDPPDAVETRFIYGIDSDTNLRMPFNRADYYIWRADTDPALDNVPDRCAPNTGVLRKAVISQDNGQRMAPLPLLDCVADMQVVYRRDTGVYTDNLATLTETNGNGIIDAQEIREQVREVRVYILAHEGQRDVNYTHSIQTINLAEDVGVSLGRAFNLSTEIGTGWQNYRWKVYTLVVKPNNLR